MAVAVPEFQNLLTGLANELGTRVARLVPSLERLDTAEQLAFISDAYPDLVGPYLQAAGQLTTVWYDEQPTAARVDNAGGSSRFRAKAAELPNVAQLAASGRWAVLQPKPTQALTGTATRSVFRQSRRTVRDNAAAEKIRWARHASANACGFCRMLAIRGAVYHDEARANASHDHCHCIAVPDRDGLYVPAPYVEKWQADYEAARADGLRTPSSIANSMDGHRAGRANRANLTQRAKTDAPPATAGGTGGGGKPPTTKPPVPNAGDPGEERRRGFKGGPDGNIPREGPPSRGGRGYSYDEAERVLEWQMDRIMLDRIKDPSIPIEDVQAHVARLQEFRAEQGIVGRLDERVGKPLDDDERKVVDKLLGEQRNVTALARPKSGGAMPDLVVDGSLAEIKASTSDNASAFAQRVRNVPLKQGTGNVFVNMHRSGITLDDMLAELSPLVTNGQVAYIRVIGEGIDVELGRWT